MLSSESQQKFDPRESLPKKAFEALQNFVANISINAPINVVISFDFIF